MNSINIVDLCI